MGQVIVGWSKGSYPNFKDCHTIVAATIIMPRPHARTSGTIARQALFARLATVCKAISLFLVVIKLQCQSCGSKQQQMLHCMEQKVRMQTRLSVDR